MFSHQRCGKVVVPFLGVLAASLASSSQGTDCFDLFVDACCYYNPERWIACPGALEGCRAWTISSDNCFIKLSNPVDGEYAGISFVPYADTYCHYYAPVCNGPTDPHGPCDWEPDPSVFTCDFNEIIGSFVLYCP